MNWYKKAKINIEPKSVINDPYVLEDRLLSAWEDFENYYEDISNAMEEGEDCKEDKEDEDALEYCIENKKNSFDSFIEDFISATEDYKDFFEDKEEKWTKIDRSGKYSQEQIKIMEDNINTIKSNMANIIEQWDNILCTSGGHPFCFFDKKQKYYDYCPDYIKQTDKMKNNIVQFWKNYVEHYGDCKTTRMTTDIIKEVPPDIFNDVQDEVKKFWLKSLEKNPRQIDKKTNKIILHYSFYFPKNLLNDNDIKNANKKGWINVLLNNPYNWNNFVISNTKNMYKDGIVGTYLEKDADIIKAYKQGWVNYLRQATGQSILFGRESFIYKDLHQDQDIYNIRKTKLNKYIGSCFAISDNDVLKKEVIPILSNAIINNIVPIEQIINMILRNNPEIMISPEIISAFKEKYYNLLIKMYKENKYEKIKLPNHPVAQNAFKEAYKYLFRTIPMIDINTTYQKLDANNELV